MATSSFYQSSGSSPAAENTIDEQVTAAQTAATTAQTASTQATTSATSAASSLTSFQTYYLGAFSVTPTTTQQGAMYFDLSTNQLKIWTGSAWEITASTSSISNTNDVPEGTSNLYFTDERVDDRVNGLLVAGSNVTLTYDDAANTLTIASTGGGGGGSSTFVGLSDTPVNYTGQANRYLMVNATEDAVTTVTPSTDDIAEGSTNLYFTNARASSAITGSDLDMGGNKVLFANIYSAEGDLPSASTYHGMFAHVHGTGKGYFAHAGSWHKLLDETSSTTTDLTEGSNLYFTDERVDDRVNALLTAGSNITLTYDDAANTLTIASTASGSGGIALTDLSASNAVASGGGSLAYNNTTGVFTLTPPDLSGYATTASLSSYATTASLATVATSGAYSDLTGTPNLSGYLTGITGESLYSLSNVNTSSSPSDGQVLTWDNANSYWTPATASSGGGGISLTDLSASNATASGGGSLAYNNTTGVFTLTPPDLSGYATTSSLSSYATTASLATVATSGAYGDLTGTPSLATVATSGAYSDLSGTPNLSSYIALTDLSAPNATASGIGSLHYNNTTGVFTYTPPDLSGYATTSSLSSYATTASLATVATSGAYGDLSGTPNLSGYLTGITGESLYSLSNVYTSSSPTDGQVLTWDNANSYWKPTTFSSGSTFAGADYFKINPALVSAASATGSDAISAGRGGQAYSDYTTQVGSAGFITSTASYGSAYGWNAHVQAIGGQAFGALAGVSANENYSTALGYNARTTAANQLMLGNTSGNGAFTSILVANSSYTPTQSMDLTTKDYVDTAVAGAGGGGGSSGGLGSYGAVNSTGTAASATGSEAVAIGAGSSSTSSYGVAIGNNAEAEGGNRKISIGYYAGYNAPDGHDTASMGYFAGGYHQGDYNVWIGANAGKNSTTFSSSTLNKNYNVGIGYQALQATGSLTSTCYKNTAIGAHSMGQGQLTGGGDNTGLGYFTLNYLTTGSNNTILGSQAGWAITSGTNNVMIGYNAGTFNSSSRTSTGSNNTFVGTRTYGSAASQSHEVVIGYGQYGRGYNTAIIAASSGAYNTGNTSTWSTASDERVKKNITDYTAGLTGLNQVNVKSFEYKTDEEIATANPELADEEGQMHLGLPQGKTDVGIIAQELEAVFPNCVSTGESGLKTVNKDELFWVMLNAIKELSAKNDALEARIVALENA